MAALAETLHQSFAHRLLCRQSCTHESVRSKRLAVCNRANNVSAVFPAASLHASQLNTFSHRTATGDFKVSKRGGVQMQPQRATATAARASAADGASAAERSVLIPIANGSEEMEAVIMIDVLRRAGADVTVASVEDSLQVTASRGVKLVADRSIAECTEQTYDLVVLPGGMPGAERLRDSAALKEITQKQAARKALYGAICAAPAVALHSWGLLDGKVSTAHPAFANKLPDTSAVEQRVVQDGTVLTSRGPGTAMEYALALVEQLYGKEKAESVAGPMVVPKGDGSDVFRRDFSVEKVSAGERPKVLVPVANGSEEMEAVIIIDVLVRAGAEVHVASVEDSKELVLSRKVKLVTDRFIDDCTTSKYDLIVLPGGMPGAQRLHESAPLDKLLREHVAEGRLYAAICAAPAVALESKGLLKGKKATAHPAFVDKLTDKSAVDARVVQDGLVVTSRGPGTAMEFALVLVERLFGKEKADAVAGPMVLPKEVVAAAAL